MEDKIMLILQRCFSKPLSERFADAKYAFKDSLRFNKDQKELDKAQESYDEWQSAAQKDRKKVSMNDEDKSITYASGNTVKYKSQDEYNYFKRKLKRSMDAERDAIAKAQLDLSDCRKNPRKMALKSGIREFFRKD